MKTIVNIVKIALCAGCLLFFNEGDSIAPNFIGLGCAAALVGLYRLETEIKSKADKL